MLKKKWTWLYLEIDECDILNIYRIYLCISFIDVVYICHGAVITLKKAVFRMEFIALIGETRMGEHNDEAVSCEVCHTGIYTR